MCVRIHYSRDKLCRNLTELPGPLALASCRFDLAEISYHRRIGVVNTLGLLLKLYCRSTAALPPPIDNRLEIFTATGSALFHFLRHENFFTATDLSLFDFLRRAKFSTAIDSALFDFLRHENFFTAIVLPLSL